ncbi:LysR family transcriptional regulator [Gottfriedia sp. NPDC056225]|uniref:LysR family transcriptional regulator n=1 Tax=Gottfriedia sp. NPDC056225 TaxID=3345751 RepID=UPI0035E23E64
MHIEQLRYIVEVAKTSSIARASENMCVTQPAVSQSITNLEKEIGFKLFIRSRQGVSPTVEGKLIIQKAYEVLAKLDELQDQVDLYNNVIDGHVTLSSVPTMLPIALKALKYFQRKYPTIQVQVLENLGPGVFKDIQHGRADIGLLAADNMIGELEHITFEQLVNGKVQVIVGKESHLASKDVLTVKDIQDQSFALYSGPLYSKGIESIFSSPIKRAIVTDNFETIRFAVAENLAIGLVLDFYLEKHPDLDQASIVPINLINLPPLPSLQHGYAMRKNSKPSYGTRKLIGYLQNEFQKFSKSDS